MAAPGADRCFGIVVAGEVVLGDLGIKAGKLVACVFLVKGVGIVFRVSGDKDLS